MRPAYASNALGQPISANIYEDAQQPNSDLIEEWVPNDSDGKLYKIEVHAEPNMSVQYVNATLENFVTTSGAKKTARYRWNWRPRAVKTSSHDFAELFALVDAVNASSNYTAQVEMLVQAEQWLRVFAFERIIANDDTYGYLRGHNLYAYKPQAERWQMFLWDLDVSLGAYDLGSSADLFANNSDPVMVQMVAHPPFRRMFWRAIYDAVNGPFLPATIGAVADANYAFLTNHYSTSTTGAAALLSPDGSKSEVPALREWITNRYNYLTGQLATVNAPFEISNNGGNNFAVTNQTTITLVGKAPVEVAFIRVNAGIGAENVTWTSVTNWSFTTSLGLAPSTNVFSLQGYNRLDHFLSGATDTITITNQP
jgi:hypothetical protein